MRDAAKLLDMTPDGVRRLIDVGKLPAVRTPSGQRIVYEEDVEQLAAERDAIAHERRERIA
jgi:excisionase family DNA binding protein